MAKRFSDEELENLLKDYDSGNGLRPFELAKKYNRDSGTIIGKLKSVGVYKHTNYQLTDEDKRVIEKYYPLRDWESLDSYFKGKTTRGAIIKYASKHKIRCEEFFWSEEEIELLKEWFGEIPIKKLKEKFFKDKTIGAVSTKAQKLGLAKSREWSPEEEEILRIYYPILSPAEVCEMLPGRTFYSVGIHARKLNLYSGVNKRWSADEDQYIKDNWKIKSDHTLAKDLGRPFRSTKWRREALGLYRWDPDRKYTYPNMTKFFRGCLHDWKQKSMELCNYKCVLTGSKNFEIHHPYSFSTIVYSFISKNNLKSDNPDDYSMDELNALHDAFMKYHDKYPLGICVDKEVHKLFHCTYGQYSNTPEQWAYFVNEYKSGVYKDSLDNKTA